jgi:aspartyl-tRNA(Asn)/glutamyl-tRNA(Gln) amidotransferase subunit B
MYGPTSIGEQGKVSIEGKDVRIRRIQLEEDPGRLIYEGASERTQITLVDYNRAGTPLVEIVTEPDFDNPRQVRIFLNILSDLLENLGVSDPSLEGAMRADANVSINGGLRVEVKNIGSFHDLEKAIHFELTRQQSLAERGIAIIQETRHWDDKRKITISSRSKEEDEDYRYILEGDIPWVVLDSESIEKWKKSMPESISSKKERYITKHAIPVQVADVLSSDKYYSDLFEQAHTELNAKEVANMITTDLMGLVDTREKREQSKLTPKHLADLIEIINSGKITRSSAKNALQEIVKTGKSVSEIVSQTGLAKISDEVELAKIISDVMVQELTAVQQARENPQTINYLVGKVMQKTRGTADPTLTLRILKEKILT